MALGDFRENNAVGNFSQCALSTAEATKCRGEAGERKKKKAPARLLLFDYGYQAGASADERGQCDNRGAEMIRNKRRTLFIKVRIDLEARLIITLLFKCEVESHGVTAQMKPLR